MVLAVVISAGGGGQQQVVVLSTTSLPVRRGFIPVVARGHGSRRDANES